MNILLFSQNAWDDKNSFGNTVSNFFGGWTDDTFSHFYIRRQTPDNNVCDNYYSLSTIDVILGLLGKKNKRCIFTKNDIENIKIHFGEKQKDEQEKINKIRTKKHSFIYFVYEIIWLSRIWIDKDFKLFIKKNTPDIFFSFAANSFILLPIIKYLKKHTSAKIVLFAADDIHREYEKSGLFRKIYLQRNLKKSIKNADKVYAISDGLKKKYEKIYEKDIDLLYKGCEFSSSVSSTVNKPIRIVYAGNLLYGREDTLSSIADTLVKLNKDNDIARLEIYSPSIISDKTDKLLNRGSCSKVMGARSYDEIKNILNECDIVLQVESFDIEQIENVKHSFSTKIIDCLQSGSGILAVGPAGINSIEYLRGIPGTWVVDDMDSLEQTIKNILSTPDQILKNAVLIRNAAKKNHNLEEIRNTLRKDFLKL